MLTTRTHYHYMSGWCSSAMHQRCAGSYAGTPCSCGCHTDPVGLSTGITGTASG